MDTRRNAQTRKPASYPVNVDLLAFDDKLGIREALLPVAFEKGFHVLLQQIIRISRVNVIEELGIILPDA